MKPLFAKSLLCVAAAAMLVFLRAVFLGAAGAVYVPSQIGDIVGLRGTIGINVRDPLYGAKPDGVTDATAAIQKAINDAAAAGGSVFFPPGTYLVTGLQIKSNVQLRGSGYGGTILKLKNGANADVIGTDATTQGYINIQGANATGNAGGITNWGLRDLTIDGNLANNTSGYGVRVYGYGFSADNLIIKNCASGGWLTDWNGGAGAAFDQMESKLGNFKIHDCAGIGLTIGGPHDSTIYNGEIFNTHSHGVWVGPNASAIKWFGIHGYSMGNQGTFNAATCCWLVQAGYQHFVGCIAEGNRLGGWIVLSGDSAWTNCHAFSYNNFSLAGPGWVIGQTADTTYDTTTITGAQVVGGLAISGCYADHLESTTSGPAGTGGMIQFVNSGGHGRYQVVSFQQAGKLYTGTPSNSDDLDLHVNGLTADGTAPLGGQKRIVTNANQGFVVTDGAGNDAFNVNIAGKKVEAPNNGKLIAYTSGYSTIGTSINFDGAGGIQMGATGAINLSKRGNTLLGINGTLTLQQSGSAQNVATSGNITITSSSNQVGVNRISTSGAATGVTMDSGAASGQIIFVVNESANSVTMAASGTSHVANGVGCVIGATTAKEFVWDSITALWYPAQ